MCGCGMRSLTVLSRVFKAKFQYVPIHVPVFTFFQFDLQPLDFNKRSQTQQEHQTSLDSAPGPRMFPR